MKYILTIFLGACLFFKGYSQVYHPIPADSVWWVEESSGPYMGGYCIQFRKGHIYPVSEINLHGQIYTEFRSNGLVEYDYFGPPPSSCPPSGYSFANNFYAYLRNDSANRKVYLFDTMNTNQEKLLYDFDLALGDTVEPFYSCPDDTFIIQNIDSVDIGGIYRRQFEINGTGWGPIYLIEGIGSNIGLAYPNFCPFEYSTDFICYHYKNWEYGNTSSQYCIQTLDISNELEENYPTIIDRGGNSFEINFNKGLLKITCVDLSGKMISYGSLAESGMIDLNHLPGGIWFLFLEIQDFTTYHKLIIKH